MNKIRILFVPCFFGMPSHFIPLLKLYQQLDPTTHEAAFFLTRLSEAELESATAKRIMPNAKYYYGGEFYSHFDIPILERERRYTVMSELAAYKKFRPDVVIDDCSFTTALARQVASVPRLTMLRAGYLTPHAARLRGMRHGLDVMTNGLADVAPYGFTLPAELPGYFDAEAYLVPALMSIERIGAPPDAQRRCYYSGPLVLDEREEAIFHSESLARFMEANEGRRIAYVTFGVAAVRDVHPVVEECFEYLFDMGFAVVSNVPLDERRNPESSEALRRRYFQSEVLPMHFLCSRAHLIIHVSGCAAYHYPIIHGKPAITIGTQSLDREVTARVLAMLGLSQHLAAPEATTDFVQRFRGAIDNFMAGRFPFDEGLSERLQMQKEEIELTRTSFDVDQVIVTTLAAGPGGGGRERFERANTPR
jgi:UDP:flavonoid glycosyltransferase YjiC (YdhE family)